MNKFEVIIPVVNPDMMEKLLKSISANTLLPKRVILIDNTKLPLAEIFKYIPNNGVIVEVYYSKTNLVNESLNLGITKLSKDCDYVSFLNDDIVLTDCFFQRNVEVFQNKLCGVACPHTVHSIDELKKGRINIEMMNRREGWAFSIKKKLLDKIPPFPAKRIATFHFDDWFWFHLIKEQKMYWFKDRGNVIFHHVGSSVAKLGFKNHKKRERNEFNKIGIEKKWGRKLCG